MPAYNLPDLGGWEQYISEFAYEAALNAYATALTAVKEGRGPIYPPSDQIFAALQQTPPERVRVVITGLFSRSLSVFCSYLQSIRTPLKSSFAQSQPAYQMLLDLSDQI